MHKSRLTTAASLSAAMFGFAQGAAGAGFAIIEQSVSGLGNAFAGGSAAAEDATTIFFNPAGMTQLEGTEFIGAVHIIMPTARFDNQGSTVTSDLPPFLGGGKPLTGSSGGNGGETAAVPNLYYTRAINEDWRFGLGINAPFGLATSYDEDWVGRYHGTDTELATININPALSYRLTDKLSLGFGVSAMYADLVTYENAIDSGTVCRGLASTPETALVGGLSAFAACSNPLSPTYLGVADASTDSYVELNGDDWGFGYNIGLLYAPTQRTRIGLHYRSKVNLTIEGDADFTVDPGLQTQVDTLGGGFDTLFLDTGFKAKVTLPETISISSYQAISERWTMMGDITWTRWSRFDVLKATFDNPTQPDLEQVENWDDNFRYSLGATYTHNDKWKWRFGLAYDEAAVTDSVDRSPRIPDNDRKWITTGVSYRHSNSLAFDVSYAHLFINDGATHFVDPTTGHELAGDFETDVDILSGEVRWTF